MRFEPISTYYRAWGDYMIPEHIDNLVNDFGVRGWDHAGDDMHKTSLIERVLKQGKATARKNDFGRFAYPAIDHAVLMKCENGMVFVLTMPYATPESFHSLFDEMIEKYRQEKLNRGLDANIDIHAVVVDNERYKTRLNGSLTAIIATEDTLQEMGLTK